MNNSKLNIPKKINVGLVNRAGTYTGKLAYVIYYDNKGKLRKEASWNSWRDHDIPNEEFDNEPTDGFVLNKKVGDYSSRYGGRSAWIRIYDPRGFEFEISVQNLIFILEECSSIKGKGLEGEFVYAWDRSDLVLLPVSSVEYKESSEFTALQTKKVTKKDMQEGCLYKSKENKTYMYIGREPWWEPRSAYYGRYNSTNYGYKMKEKKVHVYFDIENKTYITQKGFTWLAVKMTDDPASNFADKFEDFKNSKYSASFSKFVVEKRDKGITGGFDGFVKINDEYFHVSIGKRWMDSSYSMNTAAKPTKIGQESIDVPRANHVGHYRNGEEVLKAERLQSIHFYDIFIEAKNGDRTPV